MALLRSGRVLSSPITGRRYQVRERLGGGGFGETYRARVLRPQRPRRDVCLKATVDQAGWHREAYFAELLRGQPRVIQVDDTFPVRTRPNGKERPLFCLVEELAEQGDLESYLTDRQRAYTPRRAKEEVTALLKVLDLLHGGSATHGDLSPANVLVCARGRLKLSDFGVARHTLFAKAPTVTGWNPWFAPRGYAGTPDDDVFFMGQLLAMLVAGDASRPFKRSEVGQLPCEKRLQTIIRRSIGPAKDRYADAWEMLEALEGRDHRRRAPKVRTLTGRLVAFAGPLSIKRADAVTLVHQAGGDVARRISKRVDVIVVGGRAPHSQRRPVGSKLAEVERLNQAGAHIRKIDESEFRRLVRADR